MALIWLRVRRQIITIRLWNLVKRLSWGCRRRDPELSRLMWYVCIDLLPRLLFLLSQEESSEQSRGAEWAKGRLFREVRRRSEFWLVYFKQHSYLSTPSCVEASERRFGSSSQAGTKEVLRFRGGTYIRYNFLLRRLFSSVSSSEANKGEYQGHEEAAWKSILERTGKILLRVGRGGLSVQRRP